jgi:hypothetical protein
MEVGSGTIQQALTLVNEAPIAQGQGIVRIDSECLIIVADGLVEVTLSRVGKAPVVQGSCIVRIDSECLVVVSDGAIELALIRISETSAIQSHDIIRIDSDCLVIVPDGVVEVALVRVGEAPTGERLMRIWVEPDQGQRRLGVHSIRPARHRLARTDDCCRQHSRQSKNALHQ